MQKPIIFLLFLNDSCPILPPHILIGYAIPLQNLSFSGKSKGCVATESVSQYEHRIRFSTNARKPLYHQMMNG